MSRLKADKDNQPRPRARGNKPNRYQAKDVRQPRQTGNRTSTQLSPFAGANTRPHLKDALVPYIDQQPSAPTAPSRFTRSTVEVSILSCPAFPSS